MRPIREVHYAMGTLLDVAIFHDDQREGKRMLHRSFQQVRRLEELFNAYDEGTALSRLNRQASLGPIEVDEDLFTILDISLDLSRRTEGAFDITIGPLINLWERATKKGVYPDEEALQQSLSLVGTCKMRLLPRRMVALCEKGMRLDLGAIGKGYALDRIVEDLKREGIVRAFINFGLSSIFALGSPRQAEAWPVLIRGFRDGEFAGVLGLKDRALSASWTLGRSFNIGGKQYGHLLDPRSGIPLDGSAMAVTLAPTAAQAEALSTALLILGPEQGLSIIQRSPSCEGLYLGPQGTILVTPGIGTAVPIETAEGWEVKGL